MKLTIALGKVGTLALWAWAALSFIMPTAMPEAGIGQMVFLGLLAVHAGEAFAFAKGLAAEDGAKGIPGAGKGGLRRSRLHLDV